MTCLYSHTPAEQSECEIVASGGLVKTPGCLQNLPNYWGDVELAHLFAQYGAVLECRMLHNGDMTRGAGALVRMSTVQQATAAIDSLNNVSNGVGLPLLVRCFPPPAAALAAATAAATAATAVVLVVQVC